MRSLPLTSLLLALALTGCKSTPTTDADGPADVDATTTDASSTDAKPAEDAAKADDKSGGDAAAEAKAAAAKQEAAKKSAEKPKKDKKDDEQEKKDKAQKKWDDLLEDLTEAKGLFTLWSDETKVYIELDEKSLGREFMYWGHLATGAGNNSVYRGAMLDDSNNIVRFERRGKKHIALTAENTAYLPGNDPREMKTRAESVREGVLRTFDIAAEIEHEGKVLIEIGSWFKGDNLKISRGMSGSGWSANSKLSLVDEVKAFPRNVQIDVELLLTSSNPGNGNSTVADGRGVTVVVQHSFVGMPDEGYKPRKLDSRVGYFYTDRKDLFTRDGSDPVHRYISRWRLVKKDPSLDVSDPVKPITYWVDNNTPKAFRAAIKEGIESWEPAFRKAGFSNGIVAKQMPDDADWDPADVRYAVVQWSEDENVGFAIGPSRQNPRTGETIDADITMQANFLNIYSQRFDKYISGKESMTKADILAQYEASKEPVHADELSSMQRECLMMSEERAMQVAFAASVLPHLDTDTDKQEFLHAMIREVSAHEVGHTLGMRHNFKASTMRGLDTLSNATETMEKGITGSFMDYPAVNIAPPGQTQGEFFQSSIGPNDYWVIEYGYREFGSNEDAQLDAIAARSAEAGLDFGTDEDRMFGDPLTTVWDMGTDPVAFAKTQIELVEWGLANMMERAAEDGDEFVEYTRYYGMFSGHLSRQYMGLQRFLGGYSLNRDKIGQEGGRKPITPVDVTLQQAALDVMIDQGLSWDGGIPATDRVLLANQKYGGFQEWFDFWSMDPLPRMVNNARFATLLPLMDPYMYERMESQKHMSGEALDMRDVANRVFDAVWPRVGDGPDEHDLWTQADYVDLVLSRAELDSSPAVKALFYELMGKAETRLKDYSASSDATTAAHGKWLGDKIARYKNRQQVQF